MNMSPKFEREAYLDELLNAGLVRSQRHPGIREISTLARPVFSASVTGLALQTSAMAHYALHQDANEFHRICRMAGPYVAWAAQPAQLNSEEPAVIGPLQWATMTTLSLAFEPIRAREVALLLQLPPNTRDMDADPLSVKFFGAASAMMLEPEAGPEAADEFVAIASAREKLWVGHAEAMRAVAVRDWVGLPRALAKLAVLHSKLCSRGYYRNQPIHEHLSILGLGIARCAASRGFKYEEVGEVIPAALVNWELNAADD